MQARLTKQDILPNGPLRRLGHSVLIFDEIDSTNAYLLAHAHKLPDGTLVLAESQNAGRGRLGRRWEAPRGSSILLSVLLKEPADSTLIERLTMLAALAACQAIDDTTVCHPTLRWPNDLELAGRKLAGVLVESASMPRGRNGAVPLRAAVVGFGINCLQQRGHFTGELAETATSLEIESPQPINRALLTRHLLEQLEAHITQASSEDTGWERLWADWKSRCTDFWHPYYTPATTAGIIPEQSWTSVETGDLLVQLDEGGRRYFASATTTRLK